MGAQSNRTRIACLLLVATLSSALLAASAAVPPTVDINGCLAVEEGTPVRVVGVVTALRSYDSGTEVVTLVDRCGEAEVRVICTQTRAPALCTHLSIGDLIVVEGAVARDASSTIVFASRDKVSLLCHSEFVLSVEFLCDNWRLFEFDRFNVTGGLEHSDGSTSLRSLSTDHGISLHLPNDPPTDLAGGIVLVDCTLLVDLRSMTIYLQAWSLHAVP